MPCIQVKTNVKVGEPEAVKIKTVLGDAISLMPGKSEDWLMVSIEDQCQMYFGGKSEKPIAMVEVKILGTVVDKTGAEGMTGEITGLLGDTLGISPDHIYIKYEASPDWGWNGANF